MYNLWSYRLLHCVHLWMVIDVSMEHIASIFKAFVTRCNSREDHNLKSQLCRVVGFTSAAISGNIDQTLSYSVLHSFVLELHSIYYRRTRVSVVTAPSPLHYSSQLWCSATPGERTDNVFLLHCTRTTQRSLTWNKLLSPVSYGYISKCKIRTFIYTVHFQ